MEHKIQNELRREDGSHVPVAQEISLEASKFTEMILDKYKGQISIDSICNLISQGAYTCGVFTNALTAVPSDNK